MRHCLCECVCEWNKSAYVNVNVGDPMYTCLYEQETDVRGHRFASFFLCTLLFCVFFSLLFFHVYIDMFFFLFLIIREANARACLVPAYWTGNGKWRRYAYSFDALLHRRACTTLTLTSLRTSGWWSSRFGRQRIGSMTAGTVHSPYENKRILNHFYPTIFSKHFATSDQKYLHY